MAKRGPAITVRPGYCNGRLSNQASFAALTETGAIAVWGDANGGGDASEAPTGTGFRTVFSGINAFAAINAVGEISAWGEIWGSGAAPTGDGFIDIASTERAFAAVHRSGFISVWGGEFYGGSTQEYPGQASAAPAGAANSGFAAQNSFFGIASSREAFAALRDDGSIASWGGFQSIQVCILKLAG